MKRLQCEIEDADVARMVIQVAKENDHATHATRVSKEMVEVIYKALFPGESDA